MAIPSPEQKIIQFRVHMRDMKKLLLIFLILFLAHVIPCSGDPLIEPYSTPDISADGYIDGAETEDSFWDLPPYFKIIAIGAVIVALGWKIVAILTAWIKKNPKNENRLKILRFIEYNPGSTVNAIGKDLDLNRGTVRYHVRSLKEEGKILLFRNRNSVNLFRNKSNIWSKSHLQAIEPYLRDATCKKVCRLIYENPGITNMAIADRLGIARSTVSSHIRTLEEMGCLMAEYKGKSKNYYLREDSHLDSLQFFEKVK